MKKLSIILVAITIGWSACKKPIEQTMPGVQDQLTRKYCNDPIAINYNDSFPGTPDNSTCVYPVDKYIGTWDVVDSVFRVDKDFLNTVNRTITFKASTDSLRRKMDLRGWCPDHPTFPFLMESNKYGKAFIINNIPNVDTGQIICNNDTMSGMLRLIDGKDSAMIIEFTETFVNGAKFYHNAVGIKRK